MAFLQSLKLFSLQVLLAFCIIALRFSPISVHALNIGIETNAGISLEKECSRTCESKFCAVPPLLRYGKYCGVLYSGCPGEQPCDGLDACCMKHDLCIQRKGNNYLNLECNQNFLNCVATFTKSGAPSFKGNTCSVGTVVRVITDVIDAAVVAGNIFIRQLAYFEEAMATSKKVITREDWEKRLNDVKIRKEDMNRLVMNFLVTEGYVEAAEKFKMESGTDPDIDLATITDRMAVKKAVQAGNVEDAIEKVNDLNPEILDTNPQLFFHLQQQRLIELIRNGKVEEALEFAQEELAPRGEENQAFLEELEKTVALLAFEDVSNCPVGALLDVSQRLKTASEVNAAILTSQSHEKDPKLPSLLKMLIWAQNQLDEKAVYPRITNLSTASLENPAV